MNAAASVPAVSRGYDGGKKIDGKRRHVITDNLGLLLMVWVTAANVTDRQAATAMLPVLRTRFRKSTLVWADGGYTGRLVTWAKEKLQLTLQIVKRSDDMTGSCGGRPYTSAGAPPGPNQPISNPGRRCSTIPRLVCMRGLH